LSGEFDGKRWKRNIADIQDIISRIEKLPALYYDCFDLLKHLEDETTLAFCVSALCAAIKKVEARLQRDDELDMAEMRSVLESLMVDKFQIPDDNKNDFGATDKRELLEHLKDKLLSDCKECIKAAETIGKKLVKKHGNPEPDKSEQEIPKSNPSEFAEYIRGILADEQSKQVVSFEDDILPYYNGERVAAAEFVREYGFEIEDGELRIASTAQ
jgi:uncharacterized protein YuzB (UPF0349 family)